MSDVQPSSAHGHPDAAARFVADDAKAHWHDQALWWVRKKRDKASGAAPDWEALRETAEQVKAHTLSRLADYLEEFERNATAAGAAWWTGSAGAWRGAGVLMRPPPRPAPRPRA